MHDQRERDIESEEIFHIDEEPSDLVRMNPNMTLKCAADTGNYQMFKYILEVGTPLFSISESETFENCVQVITEDKHDNIENKEEYLKLLFKSALFKRWGFENLAGLKNRIEVEIDMFSDSHEITIAKHPDGLISISCMSSLKDLILQEIYKVKKVISD
jgi:hypothetical protein